MTVPENAVCIPSSTTHPGGCGSQRATVSAHATKPGKPSLGRSPLGYRRRRETPYTFVTQPRWASSGNPGLFSQNRCPARKRTVGQATFFHGTLCVRLYASHASGTDPKKDSAGSQELNKESYPCHLTSHWYLPWTRRWRKMRSTT